MTKKTQDIFIESFRHRRVSAEIGKTAKEVSQFIDSGGSSLISGGLNSDCYTPGGFGGSPNPCPPQSSITVTEVVDDFILSEGYTYTYCTTIGKLFFNGANSLVTGRNGGSGSPTECGSSAHTVDAHYHKWYGTFNAFEDVYGGYQLAAKGRWSTTLPDQILVDVFINLPDDPSLYDDCDTDLTHWTDGQYAGTMEFNMTVQENRGTGTAKFDDVGATLTINTQPTTPYVRFEIQDVMSLGSARVFRPMDYEIAEPDLGDQMVRMYALEYGVQDTTNYDNQINFRNGIVSSGSSFGSTVLPGDGWQRAHTSTFGGGVPISYRASNADGMIFRNTFETVIEDSGFPFDYYSGARVRRLGFTPTRPTNVLIKFTWINFGQYVFGATGKGGSPTAAVGLTSGFYTGIHLNPPQAGSPVGSISVNGGPPQPDYIWQKFVEYSLRINMSTTSTTAKVWRSDEDESTATSSTINGSFPESLSQLTLGLEFGWHSLFQQQLPAIIKFHFVEVNGIVILDCDRVFDTEGNLTGGFDNELNPFGEGFDLGEFDLGSDQLMSTNLIRVTESRYLLPSDAEQIQNLWIDGVHAEPNLHYTFEPPRTVLLTHTQPVGTRITAEYLSLGGTP